MRRGSFLCAALCLCARAAAAAPFAYVPNANSQAVSVIDVATHAVVASIPVGRGPSAVAANRVGTRVYVLNLLDETVSVIDTASRTVVAAVPVGPLGGSPAGLALSPDGSRVYVANAAANTLSVIDAAANAVVGSPIAVGASPLAVAVSPSGSRVYVTNAAGQSLSVVDAAANAAIAEVPLGSSPVGVAVHPSGHIVYIATAAGLVVLDADALAPTAAVAVAGAHGVAASPDGARVYVTSRDTNTLVAIDASTNLAVGDPIAVGPQPEGVSVTPDGSAVYLANAGGDSVAVVDAQSLAIADVVGVLSRPEALGAFITDTPPSPTTTVLSSSAATSAYGQAVTFTARIASAQGQPGGTVAFFDGSSTIGTASVVAGAASLSTASLGAGTHAITAVFTPAGNVEGSSSAAVSLTVLKATGTSTFTIAVLTPQYSDVNTFRATFTPAVPGGPAPAKASFKVGTQVIGEATPVQSGGAYVYTWTGQLLDPEGTTTHQMKPDFRAVTATFIDPNFTVTNPPPRSMTIQKEDARVAYAGPATVKLGASTGTVVLSATVRDINAVAGDARWDAYPGDVRNATVSFIDRSTGVTLGTVPVTAGADTTIGTATLNWAVNLGSSKSKSYTIGFIVSYYYNRNSTADDAAIVVSK